ncbi:Tubulin gamma chain [[Candida] zeylanoides]
MPGEVITLQAGQCGNQVGFEYWNELATDHAIDRDGTRSTHSAPGAIDRPELFFNISPTARYTPRSILIDMEPSVVSKSLHAMPMLNPRNVHVSEHGSGAANNWSRGHAYGVQQQEALMELVAREADRCDRVAAFQLFHSVAGGTGAGVGSVLLESLADHFGKTMVATFSVFPSNERTSDVVVQPYNTVLTLSRLIEHATATMLFDNDALNSIGNTLYGMRPAPGAPDGSYATSNRLIAYVSAALSNPLRFPGYSYSSYESVLAALVPTPDFKFVTSAVAPRSRALNAHEDMLELMQDKYKMNRVGGEVAYLAAMDVLMGSHAATDVNRGILKSQARLNFVPWTAKSLCVVVGSAGRRQEPSQFAGVQFSNNTSVATVFGKILRQYDLLARREAYINYYTEENTHEERARVMGAFGECKDAIVGTIEEYRRSSRHDYLDDNDDEVMA